MKTGWMKERRMIGNGGKRKILVNHLFCLFLFQSCPVLIEPFQSNQKVTDIGSPMRGPVAPISIVGESCLIQIPHKRLIFSGFGLLQICNDLRPGP